MHKKSLPSCQSSFLCSQLKTKFSSASLSLCKVHPHHSASARMHNIKQAAEQFVGESKGHDQCIAEIHTAPRMSRWRWSRPMLRPWKLSPASHSRHRAQTPSWGPLDRSGLSRLHSIETSELGKGKEEKEIVSFMKIMKKGLILTGSPAQCACAGDGGAVRTAHARNT